MMNNVEVRNVMTTVVRDNVANIIKDLGICDVPVLVAEESACWALVGACVANELLPQAQRDIILNSCPELVNEDVYIQMNANAVMLINKVMSLIVGDYDEYNVVYDACLFFVAHELKHAHQIIADYDNFRNNLYVLGAVTLDEYNQNPLEVDANAYATAYCMRGGHNAFLPYENLIHDVERIAVFTDEIQAYILNNDSLLNKDNYVYMKGDMMMDMQTGMGFNSNNNALAAVVVNKLNEGVFMMKKNMMQVAFDVVSNVAVTREIIDLNARKTTVYKNTVNGNVEEIAYITSGRTCYMNQHKTVLDKDTNMLVFRVTPIKAADRDASATRATKGEVEQRLTRMYEYYGVTIADKPIEATDIDIKDTIIPDADEQERALNALFASKSDTAAGAPISDNKTTDGQTKKGDTNMVKPIASADMYATLATNRANFLAAGNTNAVQACDTVKAAWDANKYADKAMYKMAMFKNKVGNGLNVNKPVNKAPEPVQEPVQGPFTPTPITNEQVNTPKADPEWFGRKVDGTRFIAFTYTNEPNIGLILTETGVNTRMFALNHLLFENNVLSTRFVFDHNDIQVVIDSKSVNKEIKSGTIMPAKYTKEWAMAHAIKVTAAAEVEVTSATDQTVEGDNTLSNIGNTFNAIANGIGNTISNITKDGVKIPVISAQIDSAPLNEVIAGTINKTADTGVAITQFASGAVSGIGIITLEEANTIIVRATETLNSQFSSMVRRICGVRV